MNTNTKNLRVLILEDDMETVALLLTELVKLEERIFPTHILPTVYSDYQSVEELVNPLPADFYDVILLDRDCALGGSFHALDIEKFGPERIVSISSTPQWNEEAKERGVERVVYKDFANLEQFAQEVIEEVEKVVKNDK